MRNYQANQDLGFGVFLRAERKTNGIFASNSATTIEKLRTSGSKDFGKHIHTHAYTCKQTHIKKDVRDENAMYKTETN